MSAQAASNTGEVKTPVSSSESTEGDLLASVISQMEARKAKPEPEAKAPEQQAEATESESTDQSNGEESAAESQPEQEAGEDEAKQEQSAVLSKIDFDQLSESEIQELATKARSKALARFSELTQDKKSLQAQLTQLQAELAKHQKPAMGAPAQIPKEFASIESIDQLQTRSSEMKSTMKWAEAHLDEAEHLAHDDVIQTDQGEFTKSQLKKVYRLSREALDEWLPAQYNQLQTKAQLSAMRDANNKKLRQEVKWMEGEDNDLRKQYESVIKSPVIDKIKKAVPEAEADIEYLIGHAMNSIAGKTYYDANTGKEVKSSMKLSPPSMPRSSAAPKVGEQIGKQIKELESKFENSRSHEDLESLLTARLRAKRT